MATAIKHRRGEPPACVKSVSALARTPSPEFPLEFLNFDLLPVVAIVRLPVVKALYSCSESTVLRGVKEGRITPPVSLGRNAMGWRVGDLRRALAGEGC